MLDLGNTVVEPHTQHFWDAFILQYKVAKNGNVSLVKEAGEAHFVIYVIIIPQCLH